MSESFRTLSATFACELDPIKGSRFLTQLAPTQDEPESKEFVQSVRDRWPDARHDRDKRPLSPEESKISVARADH